MPEPILPRRKHVRLAESRHGAGYAYFVTICTHNRASVFGEIRDYEMQRNDRGAIAETCWSQIPEHAPNVELDAFIVMANHVLGILCLIDGDNSPTAVGVRHASPLHPPR